MIHFLISRFNINHLHYVSHNLEKALDENWLQYRIKLFFAYTYPTVVNQSNKNFFWLVLFDSRTSLNIMDYFISMDTQNLLTILYVNDSDYLDVLRNFVISKTSEIEDHVISTTLDSDDGLMPSFIETVQSIYFENCNKAPFGINLGKGYIVNVLTGIFYSKIFKSNPFYSLVEDVSDFKSVCCKPHHLLSRNFETFNINSCHYWLQNIHQSNFGNIVKGTPVLIKKRIPPIIRELYINPTLLAVLFSLYVYFVIKLKNLVIKISKIPSR